MQKAQIMLFEQYMLASQKTLMPQKASNSIEIHKAYHNQTCSASP